MSDLQQKIKQVCEEFDSHYEKIINPKNGSTVLLFYIEKMKEVSYDLKEYIEKNNL